MDIEGIIVNKVAEKSGIGAQSGEPWKRATYILNINGGSIVFDAVDGKDGRIARIDALIGKKCLMHLNMDAQLYNGRYYNNITSWGGHEIKTDAQATDTAASAVPEAPASAPAPDIDNLPY